MAFLFCIADRSGTKQKVFLHFCHHFRPEELPLFVILDWYKRENHFPFSPPLLYHFRHQKGKHLSGSHRCIRVVQKRKTFCILYHSYTAEPPCRKSADTVASAILYQKKEWYKRENNFPFSPPFQTSIFRIMMP